MHAFFQIVCWDEKSFYVEQQIVRNRDNFVCAIVIARQSLMFLSPAQVRVSRSL